MSVSRTRRGPSATRMSTAAGSPTLSPASRMSTRMSRELMRTSTDESHADVDGPGRMGQGADGDKIDPRLGDGADAVEGHVPGGLERHAAPDEGDRLVHRLVRHVVEHDQIGAGGQGLADLEEAGRLDLDADPRADPGPGAADGFADAPDEAQVIVLDQDHVGQAEAVVRAAPGPHGVFLEETQAGRRL